jgi:hypothetical protein
MIVISENLGGFLSVILRVEMSIVLVEKMNAVVMT